MVVVVVVVVVVAAAAAVAVVVVPTGFCDVLPTLWTCGLAVKGFLKFCL